MEKTRGLTATELKWIAIFAMTVDHVAWLIEPTLPVFILMHAIGRMTMPIMCFLMAEGFRYTRSRGKYALRLLVFAIIAQVPFTYFMYGEPFRLWIGPETLNVLFCLMFGFLSLMIINSGMKTPVKVILVALCIIFSVICDWLFFGVLWIIAFNRNSGSFGKKAAWFSVIGAFVFMSAFATGDISQIMQLGVFLPLPLMYLYNGAKARATTPRWATNKWIFYVFYPAHLALLGWLHYGVGVL